MQKTMFSGIWQNFEVLWSVVHTIAIDMVDNFTSFKETTQKQLGYIPVFMNISATVDPLSGIVIWWE
jgi:hypothetical protein